MTTHTKCFNNSTVLIVDDEEGVCDVIARAIRNMVGSSACAHTAEDALDVVRKGKVDLIFSDLRMPGMSGIEFLKAIRKIDEKLPFVLITAHGDKDSAISAVKEGAFDFIEKPFSVKQIRSVCETALDQRLYESERDRLMDQVMQVILNTPDVEGFNSQKMSDLRDVAEKVLELRDDSSEIPTLPVFGSK